MDTIRTFIAVRLSAETRGRLGEIEKRLMASGADVKWVPESNFHITLKFLGSVQAEQMNAVVDSVEAAVNGFQAFDAVLRGVGSFPNLRRPSVIWVGITSDGDELKTLAGRIDDALEPIGFARESRPFSPHITVGRVKTPNGIDRLCTAIGELREADVDSFRIESVAVMKSDLRPNGPIYSALAEFELSKNAETQRSAETAEGKS